MHEKLLEIMSPPESPLEIGQSNMWHKIEDEIGIKLPSDYKWFIETYGTGEVGNFIVIWNPFSDKKYCNFLIRMKGTLAGLNAFKIAIYKDDNITLTWQDIISYPIFPDKDGLLPFGSSINGDVFYWQTTGLPDEWSIIIQRVRSSNYEKHPMKLATFLYQLMRAELLSFINETDFDEAAGFKKLG